jgi:predicted DNA-binding transcriptional regulator AlpA
MKKPKLYRPSEAAIYVQSSLATIYNAMKDGRLPSVLKWVPGKGQLRHVSKEALDKFLNGGGKSK